MRHVTATLDVSERFTDPVDWEPSSRPIVWPSAAMQQQEMGLGPSQVKNLNRHLVELGLVVMRDSPNGKRYGRRGPDRRIVEAYGFDLSPIAFRFVEFQAVTQAGRAERTRTAALRRRATIARNGIRQLLEAASEQEITCAAWEAYRMAANTASRGLALRRTPDDIEMAVVALERLQAEMRSSLETAFAAQPDSFTPSDDPSVDIGPKGPGNWPHITNTNQLLNPKDTVIALQQSSATTPIHRVSNQRIAALIRNSLPQSTDSQRPTIGAARRDSGTVLRITPGDLVALAPRLKPYLRDTSPRWSDLVEAADWLRDELGIPQPIWGEACVALGREQAAVAIAIVSAKPNTYFRYSAGAYFHGMISRAKAGELHLARTIWAMRQHRQTEGLR